jgi:2-polyprenyl-6-hydroxyphenyl methylase/3-demethylubiquinone-9 3-methyltransferase
MIEPKIRDDWPDSWRTAYKYDRIEIFAPDGQHGRARAYAERMARTIAMIESVATPPARILDIAAAQGNFSLRLAELGYRVTWNDLRAELAEYVQLKHEHGDVDYLPGDVFGLAPTAPYDVVLITEIIEHVAHPDEFLAQAARLARPGGHVVMTTPNGEYFANRLPKFSDCADPSKFETAQFQPDGDGHIFLLHRDEIEPLSRLAKLTILSTDLFTSFFAAGRLRTQALLGATPPDLADQIEDLLAKLPDPIASRMFTQMAVCFRKPETEPAEAVQVQRASA